MYPSTRGHNTLCTSVPLYLCALMAHATTRMTHATTRMTHATIHVPNRGQPHPTTPPNLVGSKIVNKAEGEVEAAESHPNSKRIKKQKGATTADLVETHTHTGKHEKHDHHHGEEGGGSSAKPHHVHEPWQNWATRVALLSSTTSPKAKDKERR